MSRILIISFTQIQQDARILRQIKCLKNIYKVAIAGHGQNPFSNQIKFINLGFQWSYFTMDKLDLLKLMLPLNRLRNFDKLKWIKQAKKTLDSFCEKFRPHLVICNDWNTLPLGFYIKNKYNSKIIYDSHEFAQREWEDKLAFKLFIAPFVKSVENRFIPEVDGFITVTNSIAREYFNIYGIKPLVIRNIPFYKLAKFSKTILPLKIVHHGGAIPSRKLEHMVDTMKLLPDDYELHFYLTGHEGYRKNLIRKSKNLGNIFFHKPVPQNEIHEILSEYDIGWSYYHPSNINHYYALPNKFFDFIMAGLAVFSPPLLEQKEIIEQYRVGVVSEDFTPKSMSEELLRLTPKKVDKYKKNSLKAAKELNAEKEMRKFINLIEMVLN